MEYGWMVFFEDDEFMAPMGEDRDCEGAICLIGDNPPIVFPSRQQAAKAIRISRQFALLSKEQGKVYDSDFVKEFRKVKIRKVIVQASGEGE